MRRVLIALALLSFGLVAPAHAGLFANKPGKTHATCRLPDGTVYTADAENGSSRVVCPRTARPASATPPPPVPAQPPAKAAPPAKQPKAPPAPAHRRVRAAAAPAPCRLAGYRCWQHFAADPAYASRAAAIADAENVFRRAGWPPDVAAAMAAKMRAGRGERISLANGDRLDFMRTGTTGLWRKTLVDFRKPVRGIRFVADAERWVIVKDGITYEAILPEVCNNLAGRMSGRKETPCALVLFEVRERSELRAGIPVWGNGRSDRCYGYGKVAIEDGSIRFLTDVHDIAPGCIEREPGCSYAPADRVAAPRVRTFDGSIEGLTPGYYAIRVEPSFAKDAAAALGICVKQVDVSTGRRIRASYTAIVTSADYVVRPNGQRVAWVYYGRGDMPADIVPDGPRDLYLWP